MPITSEQIARLAGVSRGTVDRVLNSRPGVNRDTAQRVREIAQRLGYVPNRAGKALSSAKRPLCLGLVLNSEGIRFFDEVQSGIESCREAYPDFNLEFRYRSLRGYRTGEQLEAFEGLLREGAQGIVITPVSDPTLARAINRAMEAGIPVVALNNDIESAHRMLYVGCDYTASGRTAAGILALMCKGTGKVAVVTGSMRMLGHNQRVGGFLSCLRETCPGLTHVGTVESGDDDWTAYTQVKWLLQREGQLDAVYFAAAGAGGGVQALVEACAHIPVVIASDATPETRDLVRKGLVRATICQEPFRQGYEAVHAALEALITGRHPERDVLYMHNEIRILQNIDG